MNKKGRSIRIRIETTIVFSLMVYWPQNKKGRSIRIRIETHGVDYYKKLIEL